MFSLINRIVSVWTNENRISSDGMVRQIELPELDREDEKGLYGRLVEIDGPAHGGMEVCSVFQPGRQVTSNCFDKGQAYYSLHAVQEYLTALGIKMPQIMTTVDENTGKAKAFPVRAHVNAVSDLNAWYSPQTKDLTFGTYGDMSKGQDKWHLASDSDVSIHEFGHLVLDQINPRLGSSWQGDGRAIHEGFGDSLAALYMDDPEMSEDFAAAIGRAPSKKDGLRTVENDLTMNDVSNEEHDKGQVYAGFFWSLKKHLSDPNGQFKLTSREAADLVLRIMFNHAALYTTSRPTSADFVNAVMRAVDAMRVSSIPLFVNPDALKSVVMMEAARRKMVKAGGQVERLETSEEMAKMRGGPASRFVPLLRTPFQGGIYEIHQQQYRASNGTYVDVIGSGIYVHKNHKGHTVLVSSMDVRPINPGEINEEINIIPSKAMSLALGDAHQRMNTSKQWMMNLWSGRPKDFMETLAAVQMDYRIAESSVKALTTKGLSGPKARLVIIPESSDLHYEIKTGLGIYYVNARTGGIKFQKDVFVN